jgi:hypothetical protein
MKKTDKINSIKITKENHDFLVDILLKSEIMPYEKFWGEINIHCKDGIINLINLPIKSKKVEII